MINCPSCEGYQRDIRQLQTELVAERAKLIVPGSMKCAKCSFGLMRVNLYVRNGTTGPGDNATEPCPNGCGPLWPETWEHSAREAWSRLETMHAELAALRERVARLVGAIEPVAKVHINRTGGNVGIAWRAIGIDGSLPALADGEVLYVLRTALEGK